MCSVTAAATTALVTSLVAGGVSAYGQYQQGKAEKSAANYNARIANLQADNEKQKGLEAEAEHARKMKQLQAQQRAGMAANGLDLTSDTPMSIFEQTAEWGERDRQTIAHNTDMDVWGLRSESSLYKAKGKNALMSSYYGSGATLLNSTSDSLWKAKENGFFDDKK